MFEFKAKPALIISDMQNGFCHPDGTFGKLGFPVDAVRAAIPPVARLLAAFRAAAAPVYHVQQGWADHNADCGVLLQTPEFAPIRELGGFLHGTWDYEVVDELAPREGDGEEEEEEEERRVHKPRQSAFLRTDLEMRLRAGDGVGHVVVAGVATPGCVARTANDAWQLDFFTTTVSDAVAAFDPAEHAPALGLLGRYYGGTATVAEVEAALTRLG